MKRAISVIEPLCEREIHEYRATVVVGTVQGDIHDMGKNTFAMLARAAGFKVIDFATDVLAQSFVQALAGESLKILGMSCLITRSL